MPTTTSSVIGLQKEKVLSNLPKLFLAGENKLITRILRNGGLGSVQVSKRSLRIPTLIAAGGKGRLVNYDGGTLGRGSSLKSVPGFVSTKGFIWALESTTEAYWGTDTADKSVASLSATEAAMATENFKQFLDALLFSPNGVLGVVTAISGNVINVANSNQFYNDQDVLFYNAVGGTARSTTATNIGTVDANNKQFTTTTTPPAGVSVGDVIMPDGSPGTAGSSLTSIYDYHVSTNTGTVNTLQRATYPGQLNANGYNVAGNLAPANVRLILQLATRKIGTNNTALLNSLVFVSGVEQGMAWESAGTAISQIFRNIPLGAKAFDPLNGTTPDTMAGRELITQLHGDPTRIDALLLKNWGVATTKEIGPYKVPGGSSQTVFPVISTTDGSVVASNLQYIATEMDVFCINPAQEAFLSGLTIPQGL